MWNSLKMSLLDSDDANVEKKIFLIPLMTLQVLGIGAMTTANF